MPISDLESGMEIRDLLDDCDFFARPNARPPSSNREAIALRHLAKVFAESPERVLQELVDAAIEYCGGDGSGISLEESDESGSQRFRWVVVSGSFAPFLNGVTPRDYSPCGTCLDSGRPQLYRLAKPYYDYLGIEAKPITDGILIPWRCEDLKGTLWTVSHQSKEAFDPEDFKLLSSLADFAAITVRFHLQQEALRLKETKAASARRANAMAHQINNPLQSLTNIIFLARQVPDGDSSTREFLDQASMELKRLSNLVSTLLAISE